MGAYKILARPVLGHGSEAETFRKHDELCLPSDEMKILKKTAIYSLLDHKGNEKIREEPKITRIKGRLQQ